VILQAGIINVYLNFADQRSVNEVRHVTSSTAISHTVEVTSIFVSNIQTKAKYLVVYSCVCRHKFRCLVGSTAAYYWGALSLIPHPGYYLSLPIFFCGIPRFLLKLYG